MNADRKLQWVGAFDTRLGLGGLGWAAENRRRRNFHRLPRRAGLVLSKGVRAEMKSPAGVFLAFATDSPRIAVRLELASEPAMNHMTMVGSAGAELFARDGAAWHSLAVAKPPLRRTRFEAMLVERMVPEMREFRLYLPLYKEVKSVSLGFAPDADLRPGPAPEERPIVFYGTSITQGGCANTAGSDFVSGLGRMLDAETINLGFSGSGKGEPEVAHLVSELDAGIYVLDFLANAPNDTLARVLPAFMKILRKRHPSTPIILLGCVVFDQAQWDPGIQSLLDQRRDTSMRAYLGAKESGDNNLHFIDGNGLIPPGVAGAYSDSSHPTSYGFAMMAERLAPQFRVIRLLARGKGPGL